ncbi:MAG: GAF domain-containing protein [Dehalococcoidia bacterium]
MSSEAAGILRTISDTLLSSGPIVIFHSRPDVAHALSIRLNVSRILGYEPKELAGAEAGWMNYLHPDDRARVEWEDRRALAEGATEWEHEYRFRHQDGAYRWLHAFVSPEFSASGQLSGLAGYCLDITERKLAAEEQAQSLADKQATRAEVEALLAATAALYSPAGSQELLKTLVEQAARLLQADLARYAFAQHDRITGGHLWQDGEWRADTYDIPVDRSVSGHIWRTGRPDRTNDLLSDPLANQASAARYSIRSLLGAPLVDPDGERLGLISVANSRRPGGFTERDERLLVAFCQYGGAILRRARDTAARHAAEDEAARRQREIEALLLAAERLNSAVAPEEVLLGVVEVAAELFNVHWVGIITNEGDHARRRHAWIDGVWSQLDAPLPLKGSLNGWVIEHRQSYRSDDVGHDPLAFHPTFKGDLSELRWPDRGAALLVPIVTRDGRVLGVLNLHDRRDDSHFSDEDQRLAEGMAQHAAVALERAIAAEEQSQLRGVILAARGVAHEINQDLGVIIGRAEILGIISAQIPPQAAAQVAPLREAATRLAEKMAQLQRTWRVVSYDTPGIGRVLDLKASSERRTQERCGASSR